MIVALCTPGKGQQEGSVERLVGCVKNSFLRQRSFEDMADLDAQLAAWPHEVNRFRPSDATGRSPAERLADEAPWLAKRPVQAQPDDWAIEEAATVTPMGTVSVCGTSCSAIARLLGAPPRGAGGRRDLGGAAG